MKMKRYINIIYIVFLLFPVLGFAQQKKINKAATKYNFSEVWVWEYTYANGKKGEMALYREPKLNYWLLTPDDADFRETDEMTLWFIVKPNGEVIQAYQDGDANSKKMLITHRLTPDNIIRLPHYWKSTGKTKYFGDPNLGFQKLTAKEYKISYDKTNDQSLFFLATTKADFGSLALFNNLNIDAKLPIHFPKGIPRNLVALSENSVFAGGSVQYTFKYTAHGEYHINLSEFTAVK